MKPHYKTSFWHNQKKLSRIFFFIFPKVSFNVFMFLEGQSFSCRLMAQEQNNKMSPPSRLVWANVLRSDLQQVHCGFDSTDRQVVIVVVQGKKHQTSRVTTAWGQNTGWKSVDGKVFGREVDWFVRSQRGWFSPQMLRRMCTYVSGKYRCLESGFRQSSFIQYWITTKEALTSWGRASRE